MRATERATKLLSGQVWLEYDEDREDRYGRTLAYVWLDKQTMLNELLLDEGLAVPMAVKPNLKNQERFEQRAARARQARVVVWGLVTPTPTPKPEPAVEEEEPFPVGYAVGVLFVLGVVALGGLVALRSKAPPKEDDGPYL